MNLMTELPKIAARELQNSHTIPRRLKFKLDLIKTCYSSAAVVRDFRDWCREHVADQFKYPIIEYIKVVDSRLGRAPQEQQADLKDPNIEVLAALSYELTGTLAPKRAIAELLLIYSVDEIRGALVEYTDHLTEKETPGAMRKFYSDGGAGAVILTRRKRASLGIRDSQ